MDLPTKDPRKPQHRNFAVCFAGLVIFLFRSNQHQAELRIL